MFHSELYLLFNSTLPVWTWKSRKSVHDRSCLPVPLGTCARPNLRNAHLIHQSILSRHNIQRRFRKNGQFGLRGLQNQGLLPVPNPTADTLLVRVKKCHGADLYLVLRHFKRRHILTASSAMVSTKLTSTDNSHLSASTNRAQLTQDIHNGHRTIGKNSLFYLLGTLISLSYALDVPISFD